MATISTVHFEPTTDNFGQLTLHTQRHVVGINYIIVLAFVAALVLALAIIGMADAALFEHASQGVTYYGGVQLNYD
jgi:hypothetical protein